jgi:hypothetical protein
MLTGIVKATRAHYAALQHRPSPEREALDFEVSTDTSVLLAGTIHVKTKVFGIPYNFTTLKVSNARRKAEVTKLTNRLQSMYPESTHIHCAYRHDSGAARITMRSMTHSRPDASHVAMRDKCIKHWTARHE